MSARKIIIVGGVAGGATAAARARRLSEEAEIIVFERGPHVSFANCGLPYHVGEEIPDRDDLLVQTPEKLRARHNLDVRVRTEVLAIDRDKRNVTVRDLDTGREYVESYDRLILSPGARPVRPPLPGIDHPKIFTLRTVPDAERIKSAVDAGAHTAIVVGGGFIGLEMVENLRRRGLTVHLVEMLDQVMPPLDREMASPVHDMLRLHSVYVHLGDAVESFADEAGKVRTVLSSGLTLTADLVVLAIGVQPESSLARNAGLDTNERGGIIVDERMQTSDPNIFAVGDAVTVRDAVRGSATMIPLAGPANRQGRIAADNALGRDSRYRGTQGTSVVRIFDLVVAMTGSSEKTLRRDKAEYEKITIHPAQHAGYYPGATMMTIKLLFRPSDGRILGAQIVGGDGVDKRIDVLAVAIQAGMTVYDLEEAELAYAPQFGSAKDPINMAGFVAANLLRGDVDVAHADDLGAAPASETVLLDVRDPAEHEAGAIPGSRLIPLNELRARHAELPKDKPIVTYCQVGLRGYTAARILRQLGYNVRNLSGGYRTYRAHFPETDKNGTPDTASDTTPVTACSLRSGKEPSPPAPSSGPSSERAAADQTLDVRGKQCPGPIVAIGKALDELEDGRTLRVLASDSGFAGDIPAWCGRTGNELIQVEPVNGHYEALIRKQARRTSETPSGERLPEDKTIVVFSNDLDRVLAALIIANGAASMGKKVTLFFTFWGLSVLRKPDASDRAKGILDRMFGWMLPRGVRNLSLSRMNLGGVGSAMMKHVMKQKNVDSPAELLAQAQRAGVRLVACAMSMDVMGIRPEELIDGVEIGGVAAYLGAADHANVNLFI